MEAAWTPGYARQQLEAWSRSGLTITAFARREGLRVQRLFWWRDRLGFTGTAARTKRSSAASRQQESKSSNATDRGGAEPKGTAATAFAPAVVKRASRVMLAGAAPVVITTRSGRTIEVSEVARVPPSWLGALVRELERTR